ncbi:MAG: mechanosensitive ion channel family protein [Nitrososphaerales archaeon]
MIIDALSIIGIAIIIAASWITGEAIIRLVTRVARRAGVPHEQIRTFREIFSLIWIGIAVALIIRQTGLSSDITTLTFSGIVGLAVSLALQTTLQNVISGILMFNDNVLRLHDSVEYSGIKGTVAKLGLRSTWIRNEQGTIVIVSNSSLLSGPLVNHSATLRLSRKLGSQEEKKVS